METKLLCWKCTTAMLALGPNVPSIPSIYALSFKLNFLFKSCYPKVAFYFTKIMPILTLWQSQQPLSTFIMEESIVKN